MRTVKTLSLLVGTWITLSCNQNSVTREDSNLAGEQEEQQQNQPEQGDNANKGTDEPVMVAGGFLRARCGRYEVFAETKATFGCGIHDNGNKSLEATITSVEIIANGQTTAIEFSPLSSIEPWHVSFTLPDELSSEAVSDVRVVYQVEDHSFAKNSEDKLQGDPLITERLSIEDDIASPQSLGYALQNPTVRWRADFNSDPTKLDINADGTPDWNLSLGTKDIQEYLDDGVFANADRTQLRTQPLPVTPRRVSVSYAFSNSQPLDPAGFGAELWVNIDLNNGRFIHLFTFLQRQQDGTQRLLLYTKNDDSSRVLLHQLDGLPLGMIKVDMLVDREIGMVSLQINGVEQGSFVYQDMATVDTGGVVLDGRNAAIRFAYLLVEVEQ